MSYKKQGIVSLALMFALVSAGCGSLVPPLQSPVTVAPTSVQPSPTTQSSSTAQPSAQPSSTSQPAPTSQQPTVVIVIPSTPTVYVPPSATPYVPPTVTSTPTPIPTITLTPTPGPSPTPDTQQTSAAVFATITALAATPTYPPTSTPRSQRTPIGAGPDENDVPPTALYSEGGIAVLTLSQQVIPGGSAALTVKTSPGVSCTLQISRGTTLASIPGAPVRVAGKDGSVAWIWTVDAKEPTGMMTLVVNCGTGGKAHVQMKVTQ
jgi:hypothetical protein